VRDAPVVLEGVPLRVDPAEVRAFHGYKAPLGGHSAELGPRLDAILTEVSSVVRPRVVYRTVGVTFLVGIGRVARVDHYFVQCRRCWAEGCPARRMPAVGSVNLIAKGAVGGGR